MTPAEVWETIDFWAGLPWPLPRTEAQQRAVDGLGWTIEVEDGLGYLMNPAFTPPEVSMSGIDTVKHVHFRITDTVAEESPASRAFLGDLFTLTVREGAARLGRPSIRRDRRSTHATWDAVSVILSPRLVAVRFLTPEGRD
jgi:hypothetical protein